MRHCYGVIWLYTDDRTHFSRSCRKITGEHYFQKMGNIRRTILAVLSLVKLSRQEQYHHNLFQVPPCCKPFDKHIRPHITGRFTLIKLVVLNHFLYPLIELWREPAVIRKQLLIDQLILQILILD